MYRILDNKDGQVLAIVFTEALAEQFIATFPNEELEPDFQRYVWEDCNQQPMAQVGDTLAQLGRCIRDRFWQRTHS